LFSFAGFEEANLLLFAPRPCFSLSDGKMEFIRKTKIDGACSIAPVSVSLPFSYGIELYPTTHDVRFSDHLHVSSFLSP